MLAKVGTGKTKTQARRWWRETSNRTRRDASWAAEPREHRPVPFASWPCAACCHLRCATTHLSISQKPSGETCNKNTIDTASRHFSMAHQWSVALKAQEACTLSHCLSERTLRNPRFKAVQIFFQDYFSSSEFIKIAVIISLISL